MLMALSAVANRILPVKMRCEIPTTIYAKLSRHTTHLIPIRSFFYPLPLVLTICLHDT